MGWADKFRQDPTLVHGMFSPAAGGNVQGARQGVLASYRGPGRDAFLGLFERMGKLPEGTQAAAQAGVTPIDLGRAVHDVNLGQAVQGAQRGRATLGMVAGQAGQAGMVAGGGQYAAAVAANPIYGGLMGQVMGVAPVMAQPQMIDDAARIAEEAAPVVAEAGEAITEHEAQMRGFVADTLEFLSKSEPQHRMDVLAGAAHELAEAGHAPTIEQLLARSIIEAPIEQAAPALWKSLEAAEAAKVAAAAIAEVAPDVAKVAPEIAKVAPALAEVAPAVATLAKESGAVSSVVAHAATEGAALVSRASRLAAFEHSLAGALKIIH